MLFSPSSDELSVQTRQMMIRGSKTNFGSSEISPQYGVLRLIHWHKLLFTFCDTQRQSLSNNYILNCLTHQHFCTFLYCAMIGRNVLICPYCCAEVKRVSRKVSTGPAMRKGVIGQRQTSFVSKFTTNIWSVWAAGGNAT